MLLQPGALLLLGIVLLLSSCVSQRLPDGAYIPARVAATSATNSTSPAPSNTSAPPAVSRATGKEAAHALGISHHHSDDDRLLTVCASYLGTPYRYGGNDRSGIDCSGLTTLIYRDVYGINLHRRSIDQHDYDVPQKRSEGLRQGDLVFFTTNGEGTCSHVGIYLKNGRFFHASTSLGVTVSSLSDSYYAPRFLGGGRPQSAR
ncbi:MAG: C40 family peptidase [Bacteroidaceae bacterium]|nr:C40 family peptidase [Bacteroidaceae bacterium]